MDLNEIPIGIVRDDEGQWKFLYNGESRRDSFESIGLTSPGTWYASFIYEKQDGDNFISKIAYYDDSDAIGVSTITPVIYGSDDVNATDAELWRGPARDDTGEGWVEIVIPEQEKVSLNQYSYYWIALEINQSSWKGIGTDDGPADMYGDLVKINTSGVWENLSDYGFNYNWLIECYVD